MQLTKNKGNNTTELQEKTTQALDDMFLTRLQMKKNNCRLSSRQKNVINTHTTFHYEIRNLQIKTIQPTDYSFKKARYQKP